MKTVLCTVGTLLLLALWLGQGAIGVTEAQEAPRLATLEIDIWPEYDRPAVLVILHGELAEDAALPASVSLRIPASSGGPTAVAYADSADGQLLNLPFDRTDAVDFVTLTFSLPGRFFQMEFYDPLQSEGATRSYSYIWPGDLRVEQLTVQVQEPAEASDLSVQPELGAGAAKPDGLTYREADLGAFDEGQTLTVDVRYQKTDPRTSTDILGLTTPAAPTAAGGDESDGGTPFWLLLLPVLGALAIGGSLIVFWRRRALASSTSAGRPTRAARRRARAAGKSEGAAGFCPQCGKKLRPNDRFCPECGAVVRKSE